MYDHHHHKKPRWVKRFVIFVVVVFVGFILTFAFKATSTLNQITVTNEGDPLAGIKLFDVTPGLLPNINKSFIKPDPEPNRVDILLLGIRGIGDPDGGSLSDAIVLVSIDKTTKKAAMLSIPRDLYVYIPGQKDVQKINYAYAAGRIHNGEAAGLALASDVVANITGVHIDHVVRADFEAFKEIIDAVGGITIYRDTDFVEALQWSEEGEFRVPAGTNHLDGNQALYYTRSRYSTSDFDRARRQQQVLIALKDKMLSLNVLASPKFAFNMMSILGTHVRTDASRSEIGDLINLAQEVEYGSIETKVLDTTSAGLLKQDIVDGIYVLLPATGRFDQIRELAQNMLK